MPITVLSPYSGRPVKVRDQDIERAVRDEEGRIFYVVARPDGGGYYAAPTRKGTDRDLQRYDELQTKTAEQAGHAAAVREQSAYDATGPGRRLSPLRLLVVMLLLVMLAAAAYYVVTNFVLTPTAPLPTPGGGVDLPSPLPTPEVRTSGDDDAAFGEAVAVERRWQPHVSASPPMVSRVESLSLPLTPDPAQDARYERLSNGLLCRVTQTGDGSDLTPGHLVRVHYTLATDTGYVVETTGEAEGRLPRDLALGVGRAPAELEAMLHGARAGERRTVAVPDDWVFGTADAPEPMAYVDPFSPTDRRRPQMLCHLHIVEVRDGVQSITLRRGPSTGPVAQAGDRVEIDYTASFVEGDTAFDSTDVRGRPLRLILGAGDTIPGVDLGVMGMREGETRELIIPPPPGLWRGGGGRPDPAAGHAGVSRDAAAGREAGEGGGEPLEGEVYNSRLMPLEEAADRFSCLL